MTSAAAALVFDFDGVIADTEPLYWRAWRQMLTHYEFAFEWEDYCRIGRGIREDKMLESLSAMLANPHVMSEIRRRLPEHKEMVQQSRRDLAIPDATIQMFRSLRGRTLALVTSSDRRDIEPLLRSAGIAECFHASVFGDEIANHKPDPEPYLLIRAKLQLQDGVVFEDSEAGMLTPGLRVLKLSMLQVQMNSRSLSDRCSIASKDVIQEMWSRSPVTLGFIAPTA